MYVCLCITDGLGIREQCLSLLHEQGATERGNHKSIQARRSAGVGARALEQVKGSGDGMRRPVLQGKGEKSVT